MVVLKVPFKCTDKTLGVVHICAQEFRNGFSLYICLFDL